MKLLKHTRVMLSVILLITVLLLTGCNNEKNIVKNFKLSQTELTVTEGQTATLTLVDLEEKDVGDYTVTWKTENDAVATVDNNGTVTAVSPGTVTVSAVVSTKKTEVSFPCTVTVNLNTTPLTSIAFSASVYSLGEGQTIDLNNEIIFYPTNAANRALTWKSSNPSIATVLNGVVAPASEGVTTVTASSADGSIVATCMIRVSEIAIDATGISFEQTEIYLTEGRTMLLTAKVTPENATGYSIVWTSSDPTVATVSNGAVTAIAEGHSTITARLVAGGTEYSATCVVMVEEAGGVTVPATKVQLSPSNMTVEGNSKGSFHFDVTVTPANCTEAPIWSTNRDDLIEIDPETGEFNIVDTLKGKDSVSVLITCTVGEIQSTAVVTIKPAKAELLIIGSGENLYDRAPLNSEKLDVAIVDDNDTPSVTWKSSDTTIATVAEDGTVTAKKAGTCTITATYKDDPTVTATYTVTVEEANFVSVKVGETVSIDPNLLPEDPTNWQIYGDAITLDEQECTVTGVSETGEDPINISCGSESNANVYVIPVYVLPQ